MVWIIISVLVMFLVIVIAYQQYMLEQDEVIKEELRKYNKPCKCSKCNSDINSLLIGGNTTGVRVICNCGARTNRHETVTKAIFAWNARHWKE